MVIKYPDGTIYTPPSKEKKERKKPVALDNFAKRGMGLEDDINLSNDFYNASKACLVYKRPTPIRIVKMDKVDRKRISEAYFSAKSTTDYNGIYREKYIDFEAKETAEKTSFAFKNIRPQQISHLKSVIEQGGIAFFIIRMKAHNETYLLACEDFLPLLEKDRKSIPYSFLQEKGVLIEESYSPRLKYLDAIDKRFFNK